MQKFEPYKYLLIDIANNAPGKLDKELFETRIKWTVDNEDDLELIAASNDWKERPLFMKATQALRTIHEGKSTGHLVSLDAVCSGLQIMSVLTGCIDGARATGLIDPNVRADAYKKCLEIMQGKVPGLSVDDMDKVKKALMTSFYGSKAEPKKLFGDGTIETQAFNESMYELSPGACQLLSDLADSWIPFTLKHEWLLPDNHHVKVNVVDKIDVELEIDELYHHKMSYRYSDIVAKGSGISNIANVVHSVDAYVMRSLIRHCSYDLELLKYVKEVLTFKLPTLAIHSKHPMVEIFIERFNTTDMLDLSLLPYLTKSNVKSLPISMRNKLVDRIDLLMSVSRPFPIITIHDDFKCHANNMNALRYWYLEILRDLAGSKILDDIFTKLSGQPTIYKKQSTNLSYSMLSANYMLS